MEQDMTQQDAKAVFEAFKSAKADPAMTNGAIVTRFNKLYEAERQARKAGEAQKQLAELTAENARLKAELGKGKTTGKSV
jgi:hypothetical protein